MQNFYSSTLTQILTCNENRKGTVLVSWNLFCFLAGNESFCRKSLSWSRIFPLNCPEKSILNNLWAIQFEQTPPSIHLRSVYCLGIFITSLQPYEHIFNVSSGNIYVPLLDSSKSNWELHKTLIPIYYGCHPRLPHTPAYPYTIPFQIAALKSDEYFYHHRRLIEFYLLHNGYLISLNDETQGERERGSATRVFLFYSAELWACAQRMSTVVSPTVNEKSPIRLTIITQ